MINQLSNVLNKNFKNKIEIESWRRNSKVKNQEKNNENYSQDLSTINSSRNNMDIINIYQKNKKKFDKKQLNDKKKTYFLNDIENWSSIKNNSNLIFKKNINHTKIINKSMDNDLVFNKLFYNKNLLNESNIKEKINFNKYKFKTLINGKNNIYNRSSKYDKYNINELKLLYKEKLLELNQLNRYNNRNKKDLVYYKHLFSNIKIKENNIKLDIKDLKIKLKHYNNNLKNIKNKLNRLKNLSFMKTLKLINNYKKKIKIIKNKNFINFKNKFKENYKTELNEQVMKLKLSDDDLIKEINHYLNKIN